MLPVANAHAAVREPERLRALSSLDVLDTPAERAFDDLAHLAAELCDTPVALVSFVDSDRQWFKARVDFPSCQTDLGSSVCKFVLLEPDLLVIPDLTADERTVHNPLVTGGPMIRFYAGAPLRTAEGHVLGSLCAIDTRPRPQGLTPRQGDNLKRLARQVVEQLEARQTLRQRNEALQQKTEAALAHAAGDAQWRGLFEQLREGILIGEVVRDGEGRVVDWRYLQVNPAWVELVGVDRASVIGRTIREVLPGVEQEWIDLAKVVDNDEVLLFMRQVGQLGRWYEGRASRLSSDTFVVMFLEVTERVRTAARIAETTGRRLALSELADCLRTTLDIGAMCHVAGSIMGRTLLASRAAYASVDQQRETVEVISDWCGPGVVSVAGVHSFRDYGSYIDDLKRGRIVCVSDVREDPRTRDQAEALLALGVAALINVPVLEQGEIVAIGFAHFSEPHVFTPEEQAFTLAVADRTRAGVARLRSEERQALVNGEISHRLKNTLALVQGLAAQTLKGVADTAAVSAFQERLRALGAAHDSLLQGEWEGAELQQVVRGAIGVVGAQARVDVEGPTVTLGPRAAMSTSLLLHELATNATKHGALSTEAGRVGVEWRVDEEGELLLQWTERGGPWAAEPTRKGFGSRLLRAGLVGTGGSDLSYGSEGLRATFRAKLKHVEEA